MEEVVVTIYLKSGLKIKSEVSYFFIESVFAELNDKNEFIKLNNYIIKKSEIQCYEIKGKEEEEYE